MRPTEAAFLELVHDSDARLRRISRVYGREPEDAEDLYQEILVQLWRALPSFRGDCAAATWVYRVALNTGLGWRRRQQSRPEPPLATEPPERVSGWPAPDQALEARERLERLHGAIARLGDFEKALITMYLDDRGYREMADVLGISVSNVGVKLHRIRKRLGTWMAEETA